MATTPQITPLLKEAMNRLKSSPDFKLYLQYQQEMYEYLKDQLLVAAPDDVRTLQGKALALRDLMKNL